MCTTPRPRCPAVWHGVQVPALTTAIASSGVSVVGDATAASATLSGSAVVGAMSTRPLVSEGATGAAVTLTAAGSGGVFACEASPCSYNLPSVGLVDGLKYAVLCLSEWWFAWELHAGNAP